MKSPLLLVVFLVGCAHAMSNEETINPIANIPVGGALAITLPKQGELIERSTDGRRWIILEGECRNVSDRTVWVYGWNESKLLPTIETRIDPAGQWEHSPEYHCGNGIQAVEVPPGASGRLEISLFEQDRGRECRVSVQYCDRHDHFYEPFDPVHWKRSMSPVRTVKAGHEPRIINPPPLPEPIGYSSY